MKSYGECRYISISLDLGSRWRSVISFTPRLLYPPPLRKELQVPVRYETGKAERLVWAICRKEEMFGSAKNRT
jgi:hypothetical protein